jgi:O-antigen ligase
MEGERRPHAIAASLAVVFLLVGSRWGSHIGVGPVYLTDVLVAAAFAHAWLGRVAAPARVSVAPTPELRVRQPLMAFVLVYVVVRFAAGLHFDSVALRDFAPYAYCVVGLLSGVSVARATGGDRSRTMRWMWVALYAHAAWCAVAVLLPGVVAHMPTVGGLQIFSRRDDFDGAVLALLAGLAFIRWAQGRGFGYLLVVGGAGFLTASMTSRAGLLAFGVALLFSTASVWWGQTTRKSRWRLTFVPVAGVLLAILLPTTFAGSRLVATFGNTSAEQRFTGQHSSATGTTHARKKAWTQLETWIRADRHRTLVGVGFGPDFLAASGANVDLLGLSVAKSDSVRSPHQYFLGSWARLGLVGLLPLMVLCLVALRRSCRFSQDRDELELFASLVVVAFLPVASVGVLLESPFGAIPFFWCVGVLAADHQRRRRDLSLAREGDGTGEATVSRGDQRVTAR